MLAAFSRRLANRRRQPVKKVVGGYGGTLKPQTRPQTVRDYRQSRRGRNARMSALLSRFRR